MEGMKKNKLFLSIRHFLQRRPNSLQTANSQPSSSSSPSDTEAPTVIADDHDQHHHQQLDPSGIVPDAHNNVVEWPAKVIGFCPSWAAGIALLSLQIHTPLPISFHFPSHAIVIALTLLFVSKFIYPKYPERAQVVEDVGVFFGVAAFFFAITIPFPLYVKLIYWTIYALALVAIFICYRH